MGKSNDTRPDTRLNKTVGQGQTCKNCSENAGEVNASPTDPPTNIVKGKAAGI